MLCAHCQTKALAVKVGPAEHTPWLPEESAAGSAGARACPVMAAPPAPAQVPAVVSRWKAYFALLSAGVASEPSMMSMIAGRIVVALSTFAMGSVELAV